MKNVKTAVLVMSLTLAFAGLAAATPWFTQDPRTLPEGGWRVEEHVLYSQIGSALSDGSKVSLAGGATDASALTLHTRVRYGARDDLTLFLDAPYVFKRVEFAGAPTRKNDDFGDLNFLAKYKYAEDKAAGKRRAVALFYKAHSGDYKGLPGLLATGSGQDNLGLVHLWEWRESDATWYANAGYVWTDSRSDTGRNPGDQWLFNLAAEHKISRSKPLNFVWELNGMYEGNAGGPGASAATSGATVISLSPGLQYVDKRPDGRSITWEAGVQVPVITEGNLAAIPDYTVYAGAYAMF